MITAYLSVINVFTKNPFKFIKSDLQRNKKLEFS